VSGSEATARGPAGGPAGAAGPPGPVPRPPGAAYAELVDRRRALARAGWSLRLAVGP